MKLRLLNKMRATKTHRDGFEAEIVLEEGESSRVVNLLLETPMDYDPNSSDACWELSPGDSDQARQFQTWLYRGFVVQVEEPGCATSDEIALRVKHSVVKHEKKQARLRRKSRRLKMRLHYPRLDARRSLSPCNSSFGSGTRGVACSVVAKSGWNTTILFQCLAVALQPNAIFNCSAKRATDRKAIRSEVLIQPHYSLHIPTALPNRPRRRPKMPRHRPPASLRKSLPLHKKASAN